MNEIEVIDGVKGEWRTVTKPEEVTVLQRVRYEMDDMRFGYENNEVVFSKPKDVVTVSDHHFTKVEDVFSGRWKNIQAFFPLPVKPIKHKVAKVLIDEHSELIGAFDCRVYIAKRWFSLNDYYMSRKSAIRGASRFCKAIGYEFDIVK